MFAPRTSRFRDRVENSFAKQAFLQLMGARLVSVSAGEVVIALDRSPSLGQQHGFFHAGAVTTIVDTAAGYAAFSLFDEGCGVLTTEFKVNLLRPADSAMLRAVGTVLKSGRTLTVCRGDVFGVDDDRETLVATGLFSMMQLEGLDD